MDLQNNLILNVSGSGAKNTYHIVVSDRLARAILFSFKESDSVEMINNIINSVVFVEDIEDGGEKNVLFGQKVILNDGDHPYPSLEYRIRIYNEDTKSTSLYLYKIRPLASANEHQYKTMISSIANYDENFLYDQDAKFLSSKRVYKSGYKNLVTLSAIILNNSNLINNSINSIMFNPASREKRIVVETHVPQKQSSRSIMKNNRAIKADTFFSSKIVQYSDFGLNRYLVYMLSFCKTQLINNESLIKKELDSINERLTKIATKSSGKSKNVIYQTALCNKRKQQLLAFREYSCSLCLKIEQLLRADAFKSIIPSAKRDASIIYYPHYLNIERQLYLPLFQGFSFVFANIYGSILSAPIKTTSKLFEAYCLMTIETAIYDLGFETISNEIDYSRVIKRFSKGVYEFELMYEIDAKDVSLTEKGEVFFIHENAKKITPDFYLVLKNNGIPVCFLIIDAKCKKVSTLQKAIETGDYERNVRDYLSLRYASNDNPFLLSKIVDSLWFLLPDDYNDTEYERIKKLEYKYCKLAIDGEEFNFFTLFYDYISTFLD